VTHPLASNSRVSVCDALPVAAWLESRTTCPPTRRPHPPLGREAQGRVVFHPDLRLVGEPDRGALRTTAAVHRRQLGLSRPHRADPGPARLPAPAQRQTPATATSWPPNARNAPASAARGGIRWGGHPLATVA